LLTCVIENSNEKVGIVPPRGVLTTDAVKRLAMQLVIGYAGSRRNSLKSELDSLEIKSPPRLTRRRLLYWPKRSVRRQAQAGIGRVATLTQRLPIGTIFRAWPFHVSGAISVIGFGAGGREAGSCANSWQKDQSGFHDAIQPSALSLPTFSSLM
jgi:hypothetical protein